MNIVLTIIGTVSSILVGIWALVQTYNFFIKPKQELKFFCSNICAFDKNDKLYYKKDPEQYFNYKLMLEATKQNDNNKNIIDCKSLYIYDIGIKNTGKKIINSNDFYQADKLSLNLDKDVIALAIREKTPKYINASLSNFTEQCAIINFDSIEPGDGIFISVTSIGKISTSGIISGKTNSIKNIKALDTKTAEICYNSLSYWEKERLHIKEGIKQIVKTNLFGTILYMTIVLILFAITIISSIIKIRG